MIAASNGEVQTGVYYDKLRGVMVPVMESLPPMPNMSGGLAPNDRKLDAFTGGDTFLRERRTEVVGRLEDCESNYDDPEKIRQRMHQLHLDQSQEAEYTDLRPTQQDDRSTSDWQSAGLSARDAVARHKSLYQHAPDEAPSAPLDKSVAAVSVPEIARAEAHRAIDPSMPVPSGNRGRRKARTSGVLADVLPGVESDSVGKRAAVARAGPPRRRTMQPENPEDRAIDISHPMGTRLPDSSRVPVITSAIRGLRGDGPLVHRSAHAPGCRNESIAGIIGHGVDRLAPTSLPERSRKTILWLSGRESDLKGDVIPTKASRSASRRGRRGHATPTALETSAQVYPSALDAVKASQTPALRLEGRGRLTATNVQLFATGGSTRPSQKDHALRRDPAKRTNLQAFAQLETGGVAPASQQPGVRLSRRAEASRGGDAVHMPLGATYEGDVRAVSQEPAGRTFRLDRPGDMKVTAVDLGRMAMARGRVQTAPAAVMRHGASAVQMRDRAAIDATGVAQANYAVVKTESNPVHRQEPNKRSPTSAVALVHSSARPSTVVEPARRLERKGAPASTIVVSGEVYHASDGLAPECDQTRRLAGVGTGVPLASTASLVGAEMGISVGQTPQPRVERNARRGQGAKGQHGLAVGAGTSVAPASKRSTVVGRSSRQGGGQVRSGDVAGRAHGQQVFHMPPANAKPVREPPRRVEQAGAADEHMRGMSNAGISVGEVAAAGTEHRRSHRLGKGGVVRVLDSVKSDLSHGVANPARKPVGVAERGRSDRLDRGVGHAVAERATVGDGGGGASKTIPRELSTGERHRADENALDLDGGRMVRGEPTEVHRLVGGADRDEAGRRDDVERPV